MACKRNDLKHKWDYWMVLWSTANNFLWLILSFQWKRELISSYSWSTTIYTVFMLPLHFLESSSPGEPVFILILISIVFVILLLVWYFSFNTVISSKSPIPKVKMSYTMDLFSFFLRGRQHNIFNCNIEAHVRKML